MRNFLTNLKFDFFFHFFTTDVLKRLVGGPKVASKIYRVVFEKKAKKKEVLTDPPTHRPTRQYKIGGDAWEPGGGEKFDISVSLNFFKIPILRKAPKYLMVLPVRARLATARARLGFSHFPNF